MTLDKPSRGGKKKKKNVLSQQALERWEVLCWYKIVEKSCGSDQNNPQTLCRPSLLFQLLQQLADTLGNPQQLKDPVLPKKEATGLFVARCSCNETEVVHPSLSSAACVNDLLGSGRLRDAGVCSLKEAKDSSASGFHSCALGKSHRFKTSSDRVVVDGGSLTVPLRHASKCVTPTLEFEDKPELTVWMDGNAEFWLKCYLKIKRTDWWRTGDITAPAWNIKFRVFCVFSSAQISDTHFIWSIRGLKVHIKPFIWYTDIHRIIQYIDMFM